MKENKNIDRLFQEQMKSLEATPSPRVWSAIEGKLKKKKRKRLPFWWFSGGVAALLILGVFLFQSPKDTTKLQQIESPIITKSPKKTDIIKNDSVLQFSEPIQKEKTILAKKNTIKTEPKKDKKSEVSSVKDNRLLAKNNWEKNETNTQKEVQDYQQEKKEKVTETVITTKSAKDSIQKKKPVIKKKRKALLPAKDSLIIDGSIKKEWTVSSVFAVLNSNSLTKSSPITSSLNNNPIQGNYTFSYGVKIGYQLNSKWSLQSGIHLQKSSFTTKNIVVISGASQSNVNTINFNTLTSYSFSNAGSSSANISDFGPNALSLGNNAQLEQTYGYIEIPFEIKYLITQNKKITTSLVAGFSSLFLTTNEIVVKNTGVSQIFGQANNLNTVNFSGNFGLDIDYRVNNHWILTINPMGKAQLNTFSKGSNGFKPYSIGFYTGVKYQF